MTLTPKLRAHLERLAAAGPVDERRGCERVNEPMIHTYCEMLEDGNPMYWDHDFARVSVLGGCVSPPTMNVTWCQQRFWSPDGSAGPRITLPEDFVKPLIEDAGFEAGLVIGVRAAYFAPARPGDHLTWRIGVVAPPKERRSRLGEAFELEIGGPVIDQRDRQIAWESMLTLNYARLRRGAKIEAARPRSPVQLQEQLDYPAAARSSATGCVRQVTRSWNSTAVGERVPGFVLSWTPRRLLHAAAGTRDWHPFHHDRAYAAAHGARGPFINQMTTQGLYARALTDWGGPESQLRNLNVRLLDPVCLEEETMVVGRVTDKEPRTNRLTGAAELLVHVELELINRTQRVLSGRADAALMLAQ